MFSSEKERFTTFLIWQETREFIMEECVVICGGHKPPKKNKKPPLLLAFIKYIIICPYDLYLWRSF